MRKALVSAGEPPLITLGEFEDMAKRCNLKTPDDRRSCMDRLTDMGELRHFSKVPGLEDVVVVDPTWLADLMATIVTADADKMAELGMENGWTSMAALEKVVQSVCPASSSGGSWVDGLVKLMQHCGLVYVSPHGDAVIPPMLPPKITQSIESHRAALVAQPGTQSGYPPAGPRRWWSAQYKYGRLLDHRLSRLLCRLLLLLPDVKVQEVWRFGAQLRRPEGDVLAMTCTRGQHKDYTIHVAVCARVPELLGARVSALLGEELGDVELKAIMYECAACFVDTKLSETGTYNAVMLHKTAAARANTKTCSQCGTELHMAPFIRSLRLDEQAARWGPDQQEGDSEGNRRLRHLLAGIELHADWLAAAAGGQGQRQGGLDAGAAAGSGGPVGGPGEPGSASATGVSDSPLRLHPVCEHPDGPHPVEGYDIPTLYDAPGASWLRTHARGLRTLMRAMELMWRHGPQEAQAAILQTLIKRLEQEEPGELDEYVSCQEARSSIEKLLEEGKRTADWGRSQGPLRRVVSRSGAVMWLCRCHADNHVW
ncbi:hypothetical protein GPECTOR_259g658 [Gonium pectorale]|uniref:COR domain-containing protein n=1 Tax=Gonium pectorale TaxID=33097 RepID=A0A150FW68_GONPE|nr:hypothetical protein GPECTOR_259g658 [Gonium pectorale]|eukprot:KXZ41862.1 hypothetical protein GPECTOR_259g658 [Gonium pectorale]